MARKHVSWFSASLRNNKEKQNATNSTGYSSLRNRNFNHAFVSLLYLDQCLSAKPDGLLAQFFCNFFIGQKPSHSELQPSPNSNRVCVHCARHRKLYLIGDPRPMNHEPKSNLSHATCPYYYPFVEQAEKDIDSREEMSRKNSLEVKEVWNVWMTTIYDYIRIKTDNRLKICIDCRKKYAILHRPSESFDSLHKEYISEHIFYMNPFRRQCRNPHFFVKRSTPAGKQGSLKKWSRKELGRLKLRKHLNVEKSENSEQHSANLNASDFSKLDHGSKVAELGHSVSVRMDQYRGKNLRASNSMTEQGRTVLEIFLKHLRFKCSREGMSLRDLDWNNAAATETDKMKGSDHSGQKITVRSRKGFLFDSRWNSIYVHQFQNMKCWNENYSKDDGKPKAFEKHQSEKFTEHEEFTKTFFPKYFGYITGKRFSSFYLPIRHLVCKKCPDERLQGEDGKPKQGLFIRNAGSNKIMGNSFSITSNLLLLRCPLKKWHPQFREDLNRTSLAREAEGADDAMLDTLGMCFCPTMKLFLLMCKNANRNALIEHNMSKPERLSDSLKIDQSYNSFNLQDIVRQTVASTSTVIPIIKGRGKEIPTQQDSLVQSSLMHTSTAECSTQHSENLLKSQDSDAGTSKEQVRLLSSGFKILIPEERIIENSKEKTGDFKFTKIRPSASSDVDELKSTTKGMAALYDVAKTDALFQLLSGSVLHTSSESSQITEDVMTGKLELTKSQQIVYATSRVSTARNSFDLKPSKNFVFFSLLKNRGWKPSISESASSFREKHLSENSQSILMGTVFSTNELCSENLNARIVTEGSVIAASRLSTFDSSLGDCHTKSLQYGGIGDEVSKLGEDTRSFYRQSKSKMIEDSFDVMRMAAAPSLQSIAFATSKQGVITKESASILQRKSRLQSIFASIDRPSLPNDSVRPSEVKAFHSRDFAVDVTTKSTMPSFSVKKQDDANVVSMIEGPLSVQYDGVSDPATERVASEGITSSWDAVHSEGTKEYIYSLETMQPKDSIDVAKETSHPGVRIASEMAVTKKEETDDGSIVFHTFGSTRSNGKGKKYPIMETNSTAIFEKTENATKVEIDPVSEAIVSRLDTDQTETLTDVQRRSMDSPIFRKSWEKIRDNVSSTDVKPSETITSRRDVIVTSLVQALPIGQQVERLPFHMQPKTTASNDEKLQSETAEKARDDVTEVFWGSADGEIFDDERSGAKGLHFQESVEEGESINSIESNKLFGSVFVCDFITSLQMIW